MATDTQTSDAVGRIVELEITNVAHGGIFIARMDGRVVFVSDTAPGEVVRARISEDSHERFLRAETMEVLRASPHRVPHIWEEASIDRAPGERAGGAEFGHLALSYQRELKSEVLRDNLKRMAGLDRPVAVRAPEGESADGAGWRTRVRLHVSEAGAVGPFASRSHRVIPVSSLPLAIREVEAAAPLAAPLTAPLTPRLPGGSILDVLAPSLGDPITLFTHEASHDGGSGRRGADRTANARSGRSGRRSARRPAVPERTPGLSPQTIREKVGDRHFSVDARGFWQVHRLAPETLTLAVQELVDDSLLDPRAGNLDLYGGVGLLAAALGDKAGPALKITTVESDALATDHAAANLAEWIGSAALTDRVDRYLQGLLRNASAAERSRIAAGTVVLDPPRSGAGRVVVDALAELRPAQLVYVACDPVALARDAGLLAGHGYELQDLRAYDLFPHTHHLEAVARFTR